MKMNKLILSGNHLHLLVTSTVYFYVSVLVFSSFMALGHFTLIIRTQMKYVVTLYFKISVLQCNYTFKYSVILINMYLL